MTIFPVIMPVLETKSILSRQEIGLRLSNLARKALRLSAKKNGVHFKEFKKDGKGAPLPINEFYWSVSHKAKCVCAVLARGRIGIDIEEIKPRSKSIFLLAANEKEWGLTRNKSWKNFYRYWTAKESILKATGIGLDGLKDCRIFSVLDDTNIVIKYKSLYYQIEQYYYKNHIISILKNENEVEWIIAE